MSTMNNQITVELNGLAAKATSAKAGSTGKTKAIISMMLALFGIIVTVTGLGLMAAPHGPAAAQGWTFLGMSGRVMKDLHIWLGFGMVLPVMAHMVLNFKMFMGECKQLFR
ncbi:DUF4405 domain-containing protein [Heliophilum fasciatum]|uniref:Uncharacterized protein DUF4405 n=1 Tax=Heliophilum fasciatum TaxID=35700 RepID=A0A4R2RZC9_9FIRM|nr:DUF4405 domain-containing protein [Heliophilum fasciatum]MCW2276671.1 hypothetical protein [Heliophilum fasciatum]TCP68948.1 uncharacterized protein DUF4405 [Heliophilum fasciatum]